MNQYAVTCRLLIHVKDVCIVIENVISSVILFAYVIIITMMVTTMMMRGCSEEKGACTAYAWEATAYNLLQQLMIYGTYQLDQY